MILFYRYELVETILSTGIVSEILIRQADRRDSALFSCIANNAYGRDDTNIQLIVQGMYECKSYVKTTVLLTKYYYIF